MIEFFRKYAWRIIFGSLAAIIVIFLSVMLYFNALLNKINRVEAVEPTLSAEELAEFIEETLPTEEIAQTEPMTEPPTQPPTEEPTEPPEPGSEIINILLIGQDRRTGQDRQRSDAMILCTVNTEKKTLVLTSFLRDTYVKFPRGYKSNRLNVPYLLGGMELLDETLKLNFGVEVDYNVEVDFSGFKSVIDMVGGVEIKLTQKEADHINKVMENKELTQGVNVLNGEQALIYARIRKFDSDFGRTNRQRKVLNSLFYQIRNASITELLTMLNDVLPLITTDMTNEEIVTTLFRVFPILRDLEVSAQHIPAEGAYQYETIDGMSVIVPHYNRNRQILKETIG